MKERRRYEFRGKHLSAGEIAKATGIPQPVISSRLHAGKRGEALAETPVSRGEAGRRALQRTRERKRAETNPDAVMSHEEIAAEMGISRKLSHNLEKSALAKARRFIARKGITKDDLI